MYIYMTSKYAMTFIYINKIYVCLSVFLAIPQLTKSVTE